jgi:pyruvate dehydrogenase E2 component (dihydrolipoamide acetyltransferase)
MPTQVIMPALELAQETGKVLRWIKAPGDPVKKGEPLVEIETDKVTVEIEAPAAGVLRDVTAHEGDVVPVGQAIARIYAPGEAAAEPTPQSTLPPSTLAPVGRGQPEGSAIKASPLARKIAAEHGVDLARSRRPAARSRRRTCSRMSEA